jgi:hypothetical protein
MTTLYPSSFNCFQIGFIVWHGAHQVAEKTISVSAIDSGAFSVRSLIPMS